MLGKYRKLGTNRYSISIYVYRMIKSVRSLTILYLSDADKQFLTVAHNTIKQLGCN